MHTLILHQIGKRAIQLQKRLRYENIQTESLYVQSLDGEKIMDRLIKAHAIILYLRSPQRSLLDLIPQIQRKCKIPIICLDEKDDTETEMLAKKYGVLWYLPQPFSIPEIALKLKFMVYRKAQTNGSHTMRLGDLSVDFLSHQIKNREEYIHLRNREFALMEYLLLNRGKILTRNMILEQVWDRNTNILSNTIDVHIARLRRKLESPEKKYFHTIHSVGYKFEPIALCPGVPPGQI